MGIMLWPLFVGSAVPDLYHQPYHAGAKPSQGQQRAHS